MKNRDIIMETIEHYDETYTNIGDVIELTGTLMSFRKSDRFVKITGLCESYGKTVKQYIERDKEEFFSISRLRSDDRADNMTADMLTPKGEWVHIYIAQEMIDWLDNNGHSDNAIMINRIRMLNHRWNTSKTAIQKSIQETIKLLSKNSEIKTDINTELGIIRGIMASNKTELNEMTLKEISRYSSLITFNNIMLENKGIDIKDKKGILIKYNNNMLNTNTD